MTRKTGDNIAGFTRLATDPGIAGVGFVWESISVQIAVRDDAP